MLLMTAITLSITVPPIDPVRMLLTSHSSVAQSTPKRSRRPWKRNIEIVAMAVAIDGESTRMRPPLVFSVAERPLWLLAPRGAT